MFDHLALEQTVGGGADYLIDLPDATDSLLAWPLLHLTAIEVLLPIASRRSDFLEHHDRRDRLLRDRSIHTLGAEPKLESGKRSDRRSRFPHDIAACRGLEDVAQI